MREKITTSNPAGVKVAQNENSDFPLLARAAWLTGIDLKRSKSWCNELSHAINECADSHQVERRPELGGTSQAVVS